MSNLGSLKNRYSRPQKRGGALPRIADKPRATPEDTVELATVRTDGDTQPRETMDMDLVTEYAERMRWDEESGNALDPQGQRWPVITVFDDGSERWLADGFHRLHAAKKAGLTHFQAIVEQGTLEQAVLHSLGANAAHGKRRTQADIKRIIERVLAHKEWSRRSNNWLAEICKVSDGTIKRHRERLELARAIPFHTSLESTNASYSERTPPFELDEDGFLLVPEQQEVASAKPAAKTTAARTKSAGKKPAAAFVPKDIASAEVIVAFPTTASDSAQLASALTTAPEHVVVPINANTPLAYEAAASMRRLTEELGMLGPQPLWISAHQRHYFIWSKRDTGISGSSEDASALIKGRELVTCGQPLGGW